MANYDIGDRVRCTASFTDLDGNPADPTTIVAKVIDPAKTETEYALGPIVREELGEFYLDVDVDLSGIWSYRFEGTGALVAAEETFFYVVLSAFTRTSS